MLTTKKEVGQHMSKSKSATIHPVDDRIFVRRQTTQSTDAGTSSQDSAGQTCFRGTIAAVGLGMPTMSGDRMGLEVAGNSPSTKIGVYVGDGVIYHPESAQEITLESGKFDIVHFRDVICVLKTETEENHKNHI